MNSTRALHVKIASVLGLSAGAIGLTEEADAQVFYSGPLNQNVGFTSGFSSSYTLDLPGDADLRLVRSSSPAGTYATGFRDVDLVQTGGYARIKGFTSAAAFFATRNLAGATWNGITGATGSDAHIGLLTLQANISGQPPFVTGPGSFSNQYAAFVFKDSTNSDALVYGWAELSMTVSSGTGPDVTLLGYAYDLSGATIPMGATTAAIPEPASSATALAFGALAFGAVRRWRASKKAA